MFNKISKFAIMQLTNNINNNKDRIYKYNNIKILRFKSN